MTKEQSDSDGGAAKQHDTNPFQDPLPVGGRESILGPAKDWPETLQAFALTIASFEYPAAIFYDEDFAIFHNQAWADVAGVEAQGQAQRGKFSADAWEALQSALHGGKPQRVVANQLLRAEKPGEPIPKTYDPVLLSPLFGPESEHAAGLLAQLIPQTQPPNSRRNGAGDQRETHTMKALGKDGSPEVHHLDISELGKVVDDFPLDEHPLFYRFAEMLPSGLAILDHRAQAVFVNQLFYQLTTHHKETKGFRSWPQSIHPEDYDRVMNAYKDAFTSQKQLRTEFRANVETNPWRLLLLTPLGDKNLRHISLGQYGGFICSIVDISSEKSAEISERKAAVEARERKEQQERFIDMISHEIRNPLSAILHCTEDTSEAIDKPKSEIDVDAIREAVETIQLCVTHQKNIVDDVLSFSKLDASMLSLTPRVCRPRNQLANSLKMFQPEFRKQSMELSYCIDHSYVDQEVDLVFADMARIGQVVINLVSNAIKFTTPKEGERKVTISVGASVDRPTSYPPNVVFFNADDLGYRMDGTTAPAWGKGPPIFILVAVKDTGIGISEEGQRRLFERFRQATPKTAEIYGGSGLGLNISRKICHLHGGEIGVSSKEGSGSTFGFFFKVKKTTESEEESQDHDFDENINSDQLKAQMRVLGNTTGTDKEDEQGAPSSLEHPPVVNAQDSTPHPDGSKDERYQMTAKVAEGVEEPKPDEYGNSERPKISEQHRTGSHLQTEGLDAMDAHGHVNSSGEKKDDTSLPHVLLVEDNVINQRIVFRKLSKKGFTVTTANNGREAVEAVRNAPRLSSGDKNAFAICLMDQEMPELDGNSATKEIRALEKDGTVEHLSIIGISANVRRAQLQEMLDSGMDVVVSKPYKIDDLVEKIGQFTSGSQKK